MLPKKSHFVCCARVFWLGPQLFHLHCSGQQQRQATAVGNVSVSISAGEALILFSPLI